jgi:hypothetical protein
MQLVTAHGNDLAAQASVVIPCDLHQKANRHVSLLQRWDDELG